MAFKNAKMGKGQRTRQHIAGEKKGNRTVCGTNILSLSPSSLPPHVRWSVFSTINTHVSTSGSLNYSHYPESQILSFPFQTKQKESTVWVPSTKARGSRRMGRAPTPPSPKAGTGLGLAAGPKARGRAPSERRGTESQGRGPAGRAFLAAPAVPPGLRARATAAGHTHRRRPGSRSRGQAAVQTLRRATPPPPGLPPTPRSKRSRATEARPGQAEDVAQEAGEVSRLRGRKARSARRGRGGEARGGAVRVERDGGGENCPSPWPRPEPQLTQLRQTSATTGSRRKMVAAAAAAAAATAEEEGARWVPRRGGTRRTSASLPQPLFLTGPSGCCWRHSPGFRAALFILVAAAAAQGPRVARLVWTVRRRETPQPSACGGGAGAGAGPRHVTPLFTVPGAAACTLRLRNVGPPAPRIRGPGLWRSAALPRPSRSCEGAVRLQALSCRFTGGLKGWGRDRFFSIVMSTKSS